MLPEWSQKGDALPYIYIKRYIKMFDDKCKNERKNVQWSRWVFWTIDWIIKWTLSYINMHHVNAGFWLNLKIKCKLQCAINSSGSCAILCLCPILLLHFLHLPFLTLHTHSHEHKLMFTQDHLSISTSERSLLISFHRLYRAFHCFWYFFPCSSLPRKLGSSTTSTSTQLNFSRILFTVVANCTWVPNIRKRKLKSFPWTNDSERKNWNTKFISYLYTYKW